MKISAAEYQEQEYELVTVELGSESTDWWLVNEWGELVATGHYDVGEAESIADFDWGALQLPPAYEDRINQYADHYRDFRYENF